MKKYNVTVNGEAFYVEVEEVSSSATVAAAPTAPAPKAAPAPAAPAAAPATAPAAAPSAAPVAVGADDTVIKCPIPGVVMKICCSVGQSVKSGEVLLIIEAMKMENEIMAPQDGVIKSIAVSSGASVQTDDIMIVM